MSARDIFHQAVKNALIKDGWTITHDPLSFSIGGVEMFVDLGIAVEIKSFAGPSNISEFHTALGQFLDYEQALEEQEPDRVLYLAVPVDVYDTFFILQFIQTAIRRHQLRLVIYEPEQEVIVRWQS
ncbi:TPA: fatty-acid oxidation protein subunit alpha [Candidatus Poribacteria bacterium]|nr:fatty-acid oxidation protein subunit alpha [Candidatus Poribacteria bacterium]